MFCLLIFIVMNEVDFFANHDLVLIGVAMIYGYYLIMKRGREDR